MLLPNRHGSTDDYRYGFQGQEKDDEIKGEGNSMNYKYRMHDPRVARFFAPDPLEAIYNWNSPYAFSENRVIDGIELEGLEWTWYLRAYVKSEAKLIPADEKTVLRQVVDGVLITIDKTFEGIEYTVKNPDKVAKGLGNLALVGLAQAGSPTYSDAVLQRTDEKLGTSTIATKEAFSKSINDGADKLVNGSVQDKTEIISAIGLGILGDKGFSKVLQVGKLTVLAKIPGGRKLVQYIAGEHKYLYTADDAGKIIRAQADDLKLKTHEGRLNHDPNTPGKMPDDHAGHLFADLFGGDPTLKNLVSQASNVNLSAFKTIENTWKKAVNAGKKVEVDIKVIYDDGAVRPSSFDVTYKIDGKVSNQVIENVNPPKD